LQHRIKLIAGFSQFTKVEFFDLNNKSIGLLKEKYSFKSHSLNHKLELSNNERCELNSESFIEHNLISKDGKIDFYEQKGNDIGIFVKEKQIGIISRNKKKKMSGDVYKIEIKSKITNPLFIISFVIGYDYKFKNEDEAYITVDYGNRIIKPVKEISKNWKSK